MRVSLDDRLHFFEACFNFRDLGRYRTIDGAALRWGQVYRSDSLHRLTVGDIERLQALNLSTVIDLRSPEEIADYGRLPEEVRGSSWHHEPIIESLVLRAGQRQQLPAGEEARRTRSARATPSSWVTAPGR